MDLLGLYSVLG